MDKQIIKNIFEKGVFYCKEIVDYSRDKSSQTTDRIALAKNTQAQIIEELKREDLSKEERKKLIDTLYKITPNENAIQGIIRGTSAAKTNVAIISLVAITYIVFNRKR